MQKLKFKNFVIGGLNLVVESSIYYLASFLIKSFNLEYQVIKVAVIDDLFQFNKWWIIPYVVAYAWWVLSGAIINTSKDKDKYNYLFTMIITVLIGGIIFISYPTRMDRLSEGVLEQLTGNDIISKFCLFIFNNDGGRYGANLFPSFHVIVSILCVLGINKMPKTPNWYKVFNFVMAILVCLSTLYTKQHYVLDVISGTLIPVVVYIIVNKIDLYSKIFKKLT